MTEEEEEVSEMNSARKSSAHPFRSDREFKHKSGGAASAADDEGDNNKQISPKVARHSISSDCPTSADSAASFELNFNRVSQKHFCYSGGVGGE